MSIGDDRQPHPSRRPGRRRVPLQHVVRLAAVLVVLAGLLGALDVARSDSAPGAAAVSTPDKKKPKPKPKPKPAGFKPQPGRYYMTDTEIAQLRKAITTRPWVKAAWANTKAAADAALGHPPNPAPAAGDYSGSGRDANNQCSGPPSGWACLLYPQGLRDGQDALNLARAYAVTGNPAYAGKAKEFILAWARTYHTPNPTVAHDIAEPGGFMLKGLLAYDLVRPVFTASERQEVVNWARKFIADGEGRADAQRDYPGLPDQTFNGDTSNWQSFGNSSAFSRALAVAAAAVVGGDTLKNVLAWNWSHTTRGGHSYGWSDLIDGEIIDGTGGETFEGRGRNDIFYGLFGSSALLVVANIAKHAGYKVNLFTYTTPRGNSLLAPFVFYSGYLDFTKQWDPGNGAYSKRDDGAATYRAAIETALPNAPPKVAAVFKRVVGYGGASRRGSNFDPYIGIYNALNATS